MTQEIYSGSWKDDVIAIAVENSEITVASSGTATFTVRAVFGGSMPSQRKDNSEFTFAIETTPEMTATGSQVGTNTGIFTAGSTAGAAMVSVTLTGYENVPPAYAHVTVTA